MNRREVITESLVVWTLNHECNDLPEHEIREKLDELSMTDLEDLAFEILEETCKVTPRS